MITESKMLLMGDSKLQDNSKGTAAESKFIGSGYKGMDGKTYKSFLDYRKNSLQQLKIMTQINDRVRDLPTAERLSPVASGKTP